MLCCVWSLSHVQLFAIPCTVAHQASLFKGILQARILEWVAMLSSGGLPNPGIEPKSPALQVDSFPSNHEGSPGMLDWVTYSFCRGSS